MKTLNFFQNKRARLFLCLWGLVVSAFGQSTLTVNVDQAATVVPKELYGVLTERLGSCINGGLWVGKTSSVPNISGMRKDIIHGFKEAGVGCILYPGGSAANGYNWQPPNPSNDLGTDQYMEMCDSVGSTPYLAGPGTSSAAQSNHDWVKYIDSNTTHPGWNLPWFKIGNEVWGVSNIKTEAVYEPFYTANYNLLKNPINGKKVLLVAGTELIGNDNWAWTKTMLQNIGSQIDGIEIHDYIYHPSDVPCVNFTAAQYFNVCNAAGDGQIAPRLNQLVPIMNQYDAAKRIKIIEDEWGDWFETFGSRGFFQQITVLDALSTAIQLHVFMLHADRIQITCLAQAINVIHALFLTDASNSSALVKTPSFYVYKLFVPHHTANAKWAPNTLTSEKITAGGYTQSVVSAGATVDSLGRVNISLSNIDTLNSRTVVVTLNSSRPSYSIGSAQVVTGPAKNSYNDFNKTEVVNIQTLAASNVTLSGKSLTVKVPPMGIVMVTLLSSVAVNSGAVQKTYHDISIAAGPTGILSATSSVSSRGPVTVTLFSADGKTLTSSVLKNLPAGKSSLIAGRKIQKGIYIVKLVGGGISLAQNVVVTR